MSVGHLLPVVVVCGALVAGSAAWGAELPSEATILDTLSKDHPRLMLTDKRLAELKALSAKDPLLKKAFDEVIRQADAALKAEPLKGEKTGPRMLLHQISRECVSRVYPLGLAWRLTGKRAYADKVRENLLTVCSFDNWNPAHFLDTAEMAHAVGIGYDWVYDTLSERDRATIRAALVVKALLPGLEMHEKNLWWTRSAYNWNQVCHGGLLVAALAIGDTDPVPARKMVYYAVRSLPKALVTYEPDGAWGEGPGYWNYATVYTCYGLGALDTALGTDFGLSDNPPLALAGLFPIYMTGPTGMYANFADMTERSRRRNLPCLFWLGRRYKSPRMIYEERRMIERRSARCADVIWWAPEPDGKLAPLDLDRQFRGSVPVAVMRSAWDDPNALFLSIKGGFNQVNHGHLDLGTFELDALGVRWARDLGADGYELPGYWFGNKQTGQRWTYYRLNSLSHNIVVLNGQNQDVQAKASVAEILSSADGASVAVDLDQAYRPLATSVRRQAALVDKRRAAVITDTLEIPEPCEVAWGMTTDAKIAPAADGTAVLSLEGKKLRAEILSPKGAQFTVESAAQPKPEKPNTGVRRLMIRLKDQKGRLRIEVKFTPLGNE